MFNLRRILLNAKKRRGYSASLKSPNFMTILDNGIRVATEETSSPIVAISLLVEAGPRFETCTNNGISHFIGHMAFKGLRSHPQSALEQTIIDAGARLWSHTSMEVQSFTGICHPDFAEKMVTILSSIITDTEFNQQQIEDERCQMSCELLEIDHNPRKTVFEYLLSTAYQGTNMGQRVIGSSDNIRSFDTVALNAFMNEQYQPWRLVFAASGGVKHSEMVDHVFNRIGCITANPAVLKRYSCVRYTGSQVMYRDDSMPHCHVALAVEAPGIDNPEEWLAFLLARDVIGSWSRNCGGQINTGGANVMSGLARAASSDGLCESFESFYKVYRDTGLWGIYFVGDPMKLEDMVANILDQWLKMCKLATYTDLQRAISNVKLNLMRSSEGSVRSCHDLGLQILYKCHRKTVADLHCKLLAMKTPDWLRIMDKYIYDKCPVIASVGPSEALPEYTRIRAGMYWLRL